MLVRELKEELEARSESKTGNKAWLRRRLHGAIVRAHRSSARCRCPVGLGGQRPRARGWGRCIGGCGGWRLWGFGTLGLGLRGARVMEGARMQSTPAALSSYSSAEQELAVPLGESSVARKGPLAKQACYRWASVRPVTVELRCSRCQAAYWGGNDNYYARFGFKRSRSLDYRSSLSCRSLFQNRLSKLPFAQTDPPTLSCRSPFLTKARHLKVRAGGNERGAGTRHLPEQGGSKPHTRAIEQPRSQCDSDSDRDAPTRARRREHGHVH